jgi:hypothetical protein
MMFATRTARIRSRTILGRLIQEKNYPIKTPIVPRRTFAAASSSRVDDAVPPARPSPTTPPGTCPLSGDGDGRSERSPFSPPRNSYLALALQPPSRRRKEFPSPLPQEERMPPKPPGRTTKAWSKRTCLSRRTSPLPTTSANGVDRGGVDDCPSRRDLEIGSAKGGAPTFRPGGGRRNVASGAVLASTVCPIQYTL